MKMWYHAKGNDSDIVVSTRVRLARNIAEVPFPPKWSDPAAKEITDGVKKALDATKEKFSFLNLDNAPQRNKSALVEDHIISREMLSGKNKALFLNEAGTAAVMVGEEDHIRIQAIAAGFDLENVFAAADAIDDAMGKVLDFAFDEQFGFLTHCPTNVGTGMRASVMLHLPALRMAGNINSLIGQVGKLGLTIRGVYGEGSESRGDLYQLSNQITLGLSEQQTIEKLSDIVKQIIKMERDARKRLYENDNLSMADAVYRALGTLKFARKITSQEAQKLLSYVKLGIDLGIIEGMDAQKITQLMIESEPHHIALAEGSDLSPAERDEKRAAHIRESI